MGKSRVKCKKYNCLHPIGQKHVVTETTPIYKDEDIYSGPLWAHIKMGFKFSRETFPLVLSVKISISQFPYCCLHVFLVFAKDWAHLPRPALQGLKWALQWTSSPPDL